MALLAEGAVALATEAPEIIEGIETAVPEVAAAAKTVGKEFSALKEYVTADVGDVVNRAEGFLNRHTIHRALQTAGGAVKSGATFAAPHVGMGAAFGAGTVGASYGLKKLIEMRENDARLKRVLNAEGLAALDAQHRERERKGLLWRALHHVDQHRS